ncbi:hypothetical protein Misp05_23070 [Micromonospora sp. NBRC 107095]|nr:hypothetical protein Misp05_23070 [Micromonospora sp. NBRC 107095]
MCLRGALATEGTRSGNVPAILVHSCAGRSVGRVVGMTGPMGCLCHPVEPLGRSVEGWFGPKAEFVDHVRLGGRMSGSAAFRGGPRATPASSGTRGPFPGRVDPPGSSTRTRRICVEGHVITVRDRRIGLPSLG